MSGNSREHALLAMGALYAGIPYIPISPAYSLRPKHQTKLNWLLEKCNPGLVFAADLERVAPALPAGTEIVFSTALLGANPRKLATNSPDTIAKILFTSGSTGPPKAVINTHRMLVSNQAALASVLGRTSISAPPVLCDWLPWHHTFGGNHNFNFVLANGGKLYIDRGRPTPEAIGETLRNLADVAPTAYFNVPLGFDFLLTRLRRDASFHERFFSRLEFLFSAAAFLPKSIREELAGMSGMPVVSGFGATETAPLCLFSDGTSNQDRYIGKPVPGVQVKLVTAGAKYELRVKGPNVMPGYWKQRTAQPFDEEGFFCTGDAVDYANPADPARGLCYRGRFSEHFKLSNGTWVDATSLREEIKGRCGALVHDCLIIGEDRAYVSALIFASESALLLPDYRERITALITQMGDTALGSAVRLAQVTIVGVPDPEELTEKGGLDREMVLKRRGRLADGADGAGGVTG